MTVEGLNARMKSFAYPFIERKNKPSVNLTRAGLQNEGDHELGQKAVQMACLVRMLPFLIRRQGACGKSLLRIDIVIAEVC